MRIQTNKLDINKFKKDFTTLYKGKDKVQVLENIIRIINESGDSISSFLKKVDSIEEKKIQKYCRHAAIAQMYNVALDYYRDSSCYVEHSGYGETLMIRLPTSTVVLSKYGDILFNEGEILTRGGTNFGRGFIIEKIIDGQESFKYGFIDNQGARVVPCVFDHIGAKLYVNPYATFGSFNFTIDIFGKTDSIDTCELQRTIDKYDGYDFVCISEDSVLFALKSSESHIGSIYIDEIIAKENNKHSSKREEQMEELRSLLSPLLISKEKLQEIAAQK